MTPTLGWLMTFVAVVAVTALALSLRHSRRSRPTMNNSKPSPRETVNILVKACDDKNFSFEVDPWVVNVRRGRPLKWVFDGPDGAEFAIKPIDESTWPFEDRLRPPKGGPRKPIEAGNVKGNAPPGSTHKYAILVECDGRTFDIDPDIYIIF